MVEVARTSEKGTAQEKEGARAKEKGSVENSKEREVQGLET